MGTGRRLREANPSIKLISFQPDSPLHGLEGLKHMETAIVPGIYDPSLADEDMRVSTEDAYTMVRRLAREEGLAGGHLGRRGAGRRAESGQNHEKCRDCHHFPRQRRQIHVRALLECAGVSVSAVSSQWNPAGLAMHLKTES